MQKNPYKYTGPLDPDKESSVCVYRSKKMNKVMTAIRNSDYCAVLGPHNIGKTTFLLQIKNELSIFPCIYINLGNFKKKREVLYDTIMNRMLAVFQEKSLSKIINSQKNPDYDITFLSFLKSFRPGMDKKIILLFDDIENIPSIKSFLKLWRRVYHEKFEQPELKKYVVVITGGNKLFPLTLGNTSPFNIATNIYLKNLDRIESKELINNSENLAEVKFEPEAKQELIEQSAGHPQMLQHICHILVDRYFDKKRKISLEDVDNAIKKLFSENDNLKTLAEVLIKDEYLRKLIKDIKNGKKIEYYSYENLFLRSNGLIFRHGKYCAFNNKIYERFIKYCFKKKSTKKKIGEIKKSSSTKGSFLKEGWVGSLVVPVTIISGMATIYSAFENHPSLLAIFGFCTLLLITLYIFKHKK